MNYFHYDDEALNFLRQHDPSLGKVIDEVGIIKRKVEPDVFKALVSSIISQQISVSAAATIFARVEAILGAVEPKKILLTEDEKFRECGVSVRKISYIKGISEAVDRGDLDLKSLKSLGDEEVISKLVTLKGIGQWSAEMLLIFSLERLDVISFGDLMIRQGLMKVHGLSSLSKEEFDVYKSRYSPYGSVASFYLWAASKL